MNLRRAAACVLGSCLLAGCDVPTEAPILEQRWILPVESTSFGVAQLLPSGVAVSGSNFAVTVSPLTVSQSLGEVCSGCASVNGTTASVPAFEDTLTSTTTLPVSSATIASGSVQIAIQNGFSFDPTQGGGSMTITVTDPTGRLIGQQQLGAGSVPANQTVTRTLTLAPGAVGSSLVARTVIRSTGGQVTTVNTSQRITVTATPQALLVSAAQVNVGSRTVSFNAIELPDLPELGDEVEAGAIVIDITNPFGVTGSVQLRIQHSTGEILKSFPIANGNTTVRVELTREDWQAILNSESTTIRGTGTVTGGTISVTPTQQVGIKAKVDLTFLIGR